MLGPRVGPFRGLAPYGEEDGSLLFGRETERRALMDLLGEGDDPILLTGEAGVGKTSLLQAGVAQTADRARLLPIHIDVGYGWNRQLNRVLTRALNRPVTADEDPVSVLAALCNERAMRPLLILDHVEQLLWIDEKEHPAMQTLLGALRQASAKVVLSVTQGHLHAVGCLGDVITLPAEQRTVALSRFDQQTAGQVMEQLVLSGGGYMEAGLPETIANELCASGPILPAALQIVGHAAMLQGATRLKAYSRAGGALVLLTSYVERLATRAGGWRARRALSVFAEQPNPRAQLSQHEIAANAGLPDDAAKEAIANLHREGILRICDPELVDNSPGQPAMPGGDAANPRFSLLHPYLLQAARDYCAPVQRGRALARLSLRQRIHGGQVMQPHEVVRIWRYLGEALDDQERDKIQKSVRLWMMIIAGIAILPLIGILVIYLSINTSSYLHTAPALAGVERVVVRAGRPSLDFAFPLSPSFGAIELDTGFSRSSLPKALERQLEEKTISGSITKKDKRHLPRWFQEMLEPLEPVRRGAWLVLAGHPDGDKLLLDAVTNDKDKRKRATETLAMLSGPSKATRAALLVCINDKRAPVRRMAVAEAARLGKDGLKVLRQAVSDSDAQVRLAGLKQLYALDRSAARALLLPRLRDVNAGVQAEALSQLEAAVKAKPRHAFRLLVETWSEKPSTALASIDEKLSRMRRELLQKKPAELAGDLAAIIDKSTNAKKRVALLTWLTAIADKVKPGVILPTINRLANDKDPQVKAAAIGLQARFGEAEQVMETLQKLSRSYGRPRATSQAMRRAAAVGLGLVRGGDAKDRLKILKRLLKDPAPRVREAATESLLRLGGAAANEVLKKIKNGPVDVARAAIRSVCLGGAAKRRATVILANAWQTKRADLRAMALGCARSLAATSPRLSMWLADQAAVDKDPSVRQAAADAVAVALQKRGRALARLPRIYLRDRDAATRVAVLKAIARRPPKSARFLFRTVSKLSTDSVPAVRAATARLVVISAPKPQSAARIIGALLKDKHRVVWRAALEAMSLFEKGEAASTLDKTMALVVARARTKDALFALKVARKLDLIAPFKQAAQHPETAVRAAAIEALAPHGDRKTAIKALEAALRESEVGLRLAGLRALAEQSERLGEAAATLIWRGTFATGAGERWAAFSAMGRLRGGAAKKAVALLIAETKHISEERRRLAMRALGVLAKTNTDAGEALVKGATDPALDVRVEAQEALSADLGRRASFATLWQRLLKSERNALLRRTMVGALVHHARQHDAKALGKAVTALPADASIVTRTASRLALALARRPESPQPLIGWLFGW